MKAHRTLSGRLTLYSVLIFTVLLLICFNLLYWSISSLLAQRMDEDLLEDIQEFSLIMAEGGVSFVTSEIDKEAGNEEHDSVFLILLNAQMNIVYSSDLAAWDGLQPELAKAQTLLHSQAEPFLTTISLSHKEASTRVIYGILSPEHVLIIGESTEDRRDITHLLILAFTIVFLIAIPVASLLVWLITRHTVSGMSKVCTAAQGLAGGDLSVRVNAHGQLDEVQTLADTFDTMADRLQSLIYHMREMTDNIAHDLKSPLGRIRLLSESLINKKASATDLQQNALHTVSECDRLIQMINLSLDLAEAEAGVLTLNTSAIDISALADDTCDFFEPAAELNKVKLIRAMSHACHVDADANSMQRLLSNLLDNALKYTPAGGVITVSVTCLGEHVIVTVDDNGPGIQGESIDYVFDRFYRADASRGGKGCGLGLSYARAVALAHNGNITVASDPGVSTKFTVTLPRLVAPPQWLPASSIDKVLVNQ